MVQCATKSALRNTGQSPFRARVGGKGRFPWVGSVGNVNLRPSGRWGGMGAVGTMDIYTLIYLLQLFQPILGGIGTGVGVVLQLVFLLLDLGTFFLGFV